MKIGVLLSAYNSENYIDDCLKPWMELKDDFDIFQTLTCCLLVINNKFD